MRQPPTAILMIGAVLLGGCGNAYQNYEMGDWYEVGSPQQPPIPSPGLVDLEIAITTLAPGSGQEVAPGDLVQVRITAKTDYYRHEGDSIGSRLAGDDPGVVTLGPFVVWLWTGREPPLKWEEQDYWGGLGASALRRTLIGRPVGTRLQVSIPGNGPARGGSVPLYGFGLQYEGHTLYAHERNPWPYLLTVAREWGRLRISEIEILKRCPGRLYRRTARVTQWGWLPLWGGGNGDTYRHGGLNWSALEGQCAPPDGKVWLEMGPLGWGLYNWQPYYRKERPSAKFPHEYNLKRRELGDFVYKLH